MVFKLPYHMEGQQMAISPVHIVKGLMVGIVSHEDVPDLTGRQWAALLTVHLDRPPGGHTVRGLAELLNVSKPAVTRAIDRLMEFDLVLRDDDPADRRSVLIKTTPTGTALVRTIGTLLAQAERAVAKATEAEAAAGTAKGSRTTAKTTGRKSGRKTTAKGTGRKATTKRDQGGAGEEPPDAIEEVAA